MNHKNRPQTNKGAPQELLRQNAKAGNRASQLRQALRHARKMRVPANPRRRKCVDGGYRENQAPGATAIAGGDLGVCLALLKLGYSAQKSFDLVYNFVRANNQPFCWHTDTHAGHGEAVIGCGHCNEALRNSRYYGVRAREVSQLLAIAEKAQRGKPGMELIVLEREHAEKGVLVVTSSDHSVKPWDENAGTQYFIYDQTRHRHFLQSLCQYALQNKEKIDFGNLSRACDSQLEATLALLGSSQGKPMFLVDVSFEQPRLKYLKVVPARPR